MSEDIYYNTAYRHENRRQFKGQDNALWIVWMNINVLETQAVAENMIVT